MKTAEEILDPLAKTYYGHTFNFFKKEMRSMVLQAMEEYASLVSVNTHSDFLKFFIKNFHVTPTGIRKNTDNGIVPGKFYSEEDIPKMFINEKSNQ